jgi:hypothetical protein
MEGSTVKLSEYDALPWQDVESSNLRRVAWVQEGTEAELGTLWVEFKTGRAYRYSNVEKATLDKLLAAESIGRFFSIVIKGAPDRYACERVEPEDD